MIGKSQCRSRSIEPLDVTMTEECFFGGSLFHRKDL